MGSLGHLQFTNSFAGLTPGFHSRVRPTPLPRPELIAASPAALGLIGLDPDAARDADFLAVFSGETLLPGMDPVAALYAGHQFGHWVPQLGDGRAILLGEVQNPSGERWEIQLKGAGLTPYSRDGDGRAVLRSSIREYLCSEAMAALGVPTTRALCLIGSPEEVYRERIETGAMLVRMAPSHVRFGSFEVFFHRGQYDRLEDLASYLIRHHFTDLQDAADPHAELLRVAVRRTAELVARWQLLGFAHGVMNTDNMSILGLTLDYGPFAFMDAYEPGLVCNHSDPWGRYAFDRQPAIAYWNLSCLAQAMLPLLTPPGRPDDGDAAAERAIGILAEYQGAFDAAYGAGLRAKLGLAAAREGDLALAEWLLALMAANRVDYTNLFRALGRVSATSPAHDAAARDLFLDRSAFDAWAADYRQRLRAEAVADAERRHAMDRVNPRYVLRNYLAQQAIEAAEGGDFAELHTLAEVLSDPYHEQPGRERFAAEPPDWGRSLAVSCSS